MPSASYHRKQAQLFARLALATSDPDVAQRYNELALEQLAKAEEVEPGAGQIEPDVLRRDVPSDRDYGES